MLGYDYDNQAWTRDGIYLDCNHPEDMVCDCYGRRHQGEVAHFVNLDDVDTA